MVRIPLGGYRQGAEGLTEGNIHVRRGVLYTLSGGYNTGYRGEQQTKGNITPDRGFILTSYTDHAGLENSVHSRIASSFSRQMANIHAGPTSELGSMVAKLSFRCDSLNIGPTCTNSKQVKALFRSPKVNKVKLFLAQRYPPHRRAGMLLFSHRLQVQC